MNNIKTRQIRKDGLWTQAIDSFFAHNQNIKVLNMTEDSLHIQITYMESPEPYCLVEPKSTELHGWALCKRCGQEIISQYGNYGLEHSCSEAPSESKDTEEKKQKLTSRLWWWITNERVPEINQEHSDEESRIRRSEGRIICDKMKELEKSGKYEC